MERLVATCLGRDDDSGWEGAAAEARAGDTSTGGAQPMRIRFTAAGRLLSVGVGCCTKRYDPERVRRDSLC